MRSREHPGGDRRGFTLLEVTAVCAIAALVSAIALPRLLDRGDRDVTLAARRLADGLSLARDRAVLRGRRGTVWLDLDQQRWRTGDDDEIALPAGVRFAAVQNAAARITAGRTAVSLQPAGDPLPVSVDLIDAGGHGARVRLPPARGRATVERRDRS